MSALKPFKLIATQGDDNGPVYSKGLFASLDDAATHVDKLEDGDKWPEGFDAVAIDTRDGTEWLYTDKWERI